MVCIHIYIPFLFIYHMFTHSHTRAQNVIEDTRLDYLLFQFVAEVYVERMEVGVV